MKDMCNHSSDQSAADKEDDDNTAAPPALISTPQKEEQEDDPSLSIRRSTYTSDIEDNDTPSDSGASSIYKDSNTHDGVMHVVDSTCKQPTLHIWLGDVRKLWPLVVKHYLRSTSYDTFSFTPFSTKENWDKLNPKLKIYATVKEKAAAPDKSTTSNDASKRSFANETQQSHDKVVRKNDKLSVVVIQICLLACFVYIYIMLLLFTRYVYVHDGDNLATRMAVGGMERIGILFGEFMDGRHVWVVSHLIHAAFSGPLSWTFNSGQLMTDATCDEDHKIADKNIAYDGSDLIEWITSNGGFIHPNTRIGLDPTGQYRGVFVKSVEEEGVTSGGIEKDAIIAEIPWDLIIKPPNYRSNDFGTNCDALHEFYHQFQLGDESKYAPYINYMKNQPDGRIPSEWSKVGKKLLRKILDQDRTIGLPPFNALYRFEQTWMNKCNGEDTPLARSAFFQFTSRDEDNLMAPFFDMTNHSNDPKKLNAISTKPNRKGRPFTMRATRDIATGEQIINSYNRCHSCWFDEKYEDCETQDFRGTDQLFLQFGFVEDSPQFFHIPQYEEDGTLLDDMTICLDRNDRGEVFVTRFGENGSREEDELPGTEYLMWLNEHLQRLHHLKGSLYHDSALKKSMPSYEWDMTWTYHDAIFNAISAAFEKATGDAPVFDSKQEPAPRTSDDDLKDDSKDEDIEMAFIEDVIAPVEDDSDKDSEDEPSDDSADDEQPNSCMDDLDGDESEDDSDKDSEDEPLDDSAVDEQQDSEDDADLEDSSSDDEGEMMPPRILKGAEG
eukprot:scaffold167_cov140-Skeletonema_menzelii.AAC.6